MARALLQNARGRLAEHTEEEWQSLEHFAEYQELMEQARKAEGVLNYYRRMREGR